MTKRELRDEIESRLEAVSDGIISPEYAIGEIMDLIEEYME